MKKWCFTFDCHHFEKTWLSSSSHFIIAADSYDDALKQWHAIVEDKCYLVFKIISVYEVV